MTTEEILLVTGLAVLVAAPWLVGFFGRTRTRFWSPLTMFAAVFAYYFVVGPLLAIATGETMFFGMELRPLMSPPWLAGMVSLAAIYLGFSVSWIHFRSNLSTSISRKHEKVTKRVCGLLFGLGLIGFAYFTYGSGRSIVSILNPMKGIAEDVASSRAGLEAGNYFFLLINTFIPASCLWYIVNRQRRLLMRLIVVGLPVILVACFYVTLGFRHRLIMLSAALAATIYLIEGKRPRMIFVAATCAGLVFLSGLIVLTRTYGRGLDMDRVENMKAGDIFFSGFNDASTFFTFALVMKQMPSRTPFVGMEPLWVAATIPVPRKWWRGKPTPEYLWTLNAMTRTEGQAVPVVGEHYMMFGWLGIVAGGVMIGLIYRMFWNFYRANPGNPLVVVIYAVAWALCFPLVNRGYFAQALMEYFFALLPVVVLFVFFRRGFVRRPGDVIMKIMNPRSTTGAQAARH